jgi:predicted DNA-binding transcriptional regulator AlpA
MAFLRATAAAPCRTRLSFSRLCSMANKTKPHRIPTFREAEILETLGNISPVTLRSWELSGFFPMRRQLGHKRVVWLRDEVERFLRSLPAGARTYKRPRRKASSSPPAPPSSLEAK